MALIVCGSCGVHTRAGGGRCDHCGTALGSGGSASAAVLGLWLSATMISCSYPMYGITVTPDKGFESGSTGDTAVEATGDTGATGGTGQ